MSIVGQYELNKVLGSGDFDCQIRQCTHRLTGTTYAVKIYSKEVLSEAPWMWDQLAEAVQVMRTMPKNDNIVEMVECFETPSNLYILMQFVESHSLYKLFHTPKPQRVPLERKRFIFEQLVRGVLHMHNNGVAHLGIAPDHVLVGQTSVKISFLVACKNVEPGSRITDFVGTTHTVAPEILRQIPFDPFKADVWSCGVVLYFIMNNGRYPFDGANTSKHILAAPNSVRPLDGDVPPEVRDLIMAMMNVEASNRPSIAEVLTHPWVGSQTQSTVTTAVAVWDEGRKQIRVNPPRGLAPKEQAAVIIQSVWRLTQQRAANAEEDADEHPQPATPREREVPSAREDRRHETPLQRAKAKWQTDKWDPTRCPACNNPPPQRVHPGTRPYPE